jgi:hypothetical protein
MKHIKSFRFDDVEDPEIVLWFKRLDEEGRDFSKSLRLLIKTQGKTKIVSQVQLAETIEPIKPLEEIAVETKEEPKVYNNQESTANRLKNRYFGK